MSNKIIHMYCNKQTFSLKMSNNQNTKIKKMSVFVDWCLRIEIRRHTGRYCNKCSVTVPQRNHSRPGTPNNTEIYVNISGAVLALARWGAKWGPQFQLEGPGGTICSWIKDLLVYFAAELRILLVYLSESLGRLGQNEGATGGPHFSLGAAAPYPRRTAPVTFNCDIT